MRFVVRGQHGELWLDSLEELRQALRRGFVRADDPVRAEGEEHWRPAGELTGGSGSRWSRLNPWQVVVTLLGAKRS